MILSQNNIILVVDDSPTNTAFLLGILQQFCFKVVIANSGESALEQLVNISPSLILLDVVLPKMNGFELCCRLKASEATRDIPIIFMTSLSKVEDKVRGLNLGAVDYITKPLQKEEVLARVNVHIKLKHLHKQLEEKTKQLTLTLQQLQESQLQLIQKEKMTTLGQLIAGVAHEINNPIGSISANTIYASTYVRELVQHIRLYQQKVTDTEIQKHAQEIDLEYIVEDLPNILTSIQGCTSRIKDISESLRNFSRNDTEVMVPFNIHDGLESTLLILKHRLQAYSKYPKIDVIKNYGDLPTIDCLPGQLNQVFMNLLANAIDALREPTQEHDLPDLENPRIWIQTSLSDDRLKVVVRIRDNGVGISPEIQQKLFEYAFTTKPVGKGTGLGLAIAHQIVVERHGGSIEVNSTIGQGSEFVIKLPV
ncbi:MULTISPECIES: hybrid sensor histidine kinase/response regulator [Nostocales]|uniref:histidine kinase n=3 Tax=Nostocales TaxID=1161 RepID=A0A8S9T8J6_9CYAN|nr:response regulator [Tolypothrix bouteillei]KAF3887932.1 response regulator [Tolypothrix bouteillei VB521301]